MKVETDRSYKKRKGLIGETDVQRFPPIHITLETPEECDCLFHLTNYCGTFHDGHYLEDDEHGDDYTMTFKEFEKTRYVFYGKLSQVYTERHKE